MPRYEVGVSINPQEQPPMTAPQENTPTGASTEYDKSVANRGTAGLVLAVGALQQTGESLIGEIGTLTGSTSLQREIQLATKFARWGWQLSTGPIGAVAIGTEIVASELTKSIKVQEATRETSYIATLRGNSYNGGR